MHCTSAMDAMSPGAIPSIHGKSAKFITEALTGFRDGTRESTVMGRHAKGYSDEEIRRLCREGVRRSRTTGRGSFCSTHTARASPTP